MPMVKADAYGLGAVPVARALERLDPWGYGVATVEEGRALRDAGIERPIIVFTPCSAPSSTRCARAASRRRWRMPQDIEAWSAHGGGAWHLAIDTGMSRRGMRWERHGVRRRALRGSTRLRARTRTSTRPRRTTVSGAAGRALREGGGRASGTAEAAAHRELGRRSSGAGAVAVGRSPSRGLPVRRGRAGRGTRGAGAGGAACAPASSSSARSATGDSGELRGRPLAPGASDDRHGRRSATPTDTGAPSAIGGGAAARPPRDRRRHRHHGHDDARRHAATLRDRRRGDASSGATATT